MYRLLPAIIVIGMVIALSPFIVGSIDQYLYRIQGAENTGTEEVRGSEWIIVLKNSGS